MKVLHSLEMTMLLNMIRNNLEDKNLLDDTHYHCALHYFLKLELWLLVPS